MEGAEAKDYAEFKLNNLLNSSDVYEVAENGNYLNQELMDEGLAELFRKR